MKGFFIPRLKEKCGSLLLPFPLSHSLSFSLSHSLLLTHTHTHSLTQLRQQHNFLKMSVVIKMEIDDGDKFNKFDDLKVFGLMIVDTQWPIFSSDLTLNPS